MVRNWAAAVDGALTGSYFGTAVGWDTATGWYNVGVRNQAAGASAPFVPASSSSQASLQRPSRPALSRAKLAEKNQPAAKWRSRLSSGLSDAVADLTDVVSSGLSRPRMPRRDSHDASDPATWDDAALRAYLQSVHSKISLHGDREDLVRRCCEALGRPYVPVASSSDAEQSHARSQIYRAASKACQLCSPGVPLSPHRRGAASRKGAPRAYS